MKTNCPCVSFIRDLYWGHTPLCKYDNGDGACLRSQSAQRKQRYQILLSECMTPNRFVDFKQDSKVNANRKAAKLRAINKRTSNP